MLGHLMEWFYTGVGGIRQDENSLAFKNIIIRPEIVGDRDGEKGEDAKRARAEPCPAVEGDESRAGELDEKVFSALDWLLDAAGRRGLRLRPRHSGYEKGRRLAEPPFSFVIAGAA